MKYISEDGKVFDTEYACLEHENAVKEAKRKEKEIEKQRAIEHDELIKKYNEIIDCATEWLKRADEFERKYGLGFKQECFTKKDKGDSLLDFFLDYFG